MMNFRQAELADISQMQVVRHLVKENTLSDPNLVPDNDVAYYIIQKGKGWVAETNGKIVGFAIVDLEDKSVWALFVDPFYEKKGIGKKLHRLMMDWYFSQTESSIVLGTSPNTRAEKFYALQGWSVIGSCPNGETKFEMKFDDWEKSKITSGVIKSSD